MEVARDALNVTSNDWQRILLHKQGLVAFDIWTIVYNFFITAVPAATRDTVTCFLSKREFDYVPDGALAVNGAVSAASGSTFAFATYSQHVNTEGMSVGVRTLVIPFAKPYRVPFASWVGRGATDTDIVCSVEVYYEEKKVSSREMAWLKRGTEVIRTS